MATFAYVARTSAGERVNGQVTGASEQAVLAELQARQLAPVEIREVRESRPRAGRRVRPRQLAAMYGQIADLLRAGVPLLRALRLLARNRAQPMLSAVMGRVADQVSDGGPLADAMAGEPQVFPSIHVAMVRAGERGGFLEQVFERLALFLERQAEMRGKVMGNLIYPVVLLVVGALVVLGALVFLIPKFRDLYARIELPTATKILLGASSLVTDHWLVGLVLVAIVAVVIWQIRRSDSLRRPWATLQLRLPIVGSLVRDLAVARLARTLGTLLENGIPLITAMQIARDAVGHPVLEEAIDSAVDEVKGGGALAPQLESSGLFADDVVEMIGVGEAANNLAEVLRSIADTVEKRIDRGLGLLVRLLEPLLLLAMAGVVFFIFLALVVPMLRMSSSV